MLHHRKAIRQMQFMREIVDRLRVGLANYAENGQEKFPIFYHGDSYWMESMSVHDIDYDEVLSDIVDTLDKGIKEIVELQEANHTLRGRVKW